MNKSKSNQELEAQVAKVVFGYTEVEYIGGQGLKYKNKALGKERGGTWISSVPEYTQSWEAAGLVIDEMKRRGWLCVIESTSTRGHAKFWRFHPNGIQFNTVGSADSSLFVAICKAAIGASTVWKIYKKRLKMHDSKTSKGLTE